MSPYSGLGFFFTLALFWLWQLAMIFLCLRVRKTSEKRWILWIFLLLSLLPLIFTKLSVFVRELSVFSMLGISYVSFRAVQILVEIYDGHLTKLCPLDVSYFLLFFPSILSGPLDRFQRFSADLGKTRSPEAYETLLKEGLWRLATGAVYNFVLGNLIWQYWGSRICATARSSTPPRSIRKRTWICRRLPTRSETRAIWRSSTSSRARSRATSITWCCAIIRSLTDSRIFWWRIPTRCRAGTRTGTSCARQTPETTD